MNKLENWKKNEPLFHEKLNQSVDAINELITETNDLKNEINGSGNSGTLPDFYECKEQIAEMFLNDGEGIVLSGNITYFVGEAGLYARENGASRIGKNYFPCNPCLKKIASYSCLRNGGVLYQKIYEKDGDLISCLKYGLAMACVPESSSSVIYKRLSRIVLDCKAYSCGKMPVYKAVAVNDTFVNFNSDSGGSGEIIVNPAMAGMVNTKGEYKSWEDLKTPQSVLYLFDIESGLRTYITAQNCNGYIKLNTRLSATC